MKSKINCLPVYILIDTSASMGPVEDLLNRSIETLYDELMTSPQICDFAFISILSYNTTVELVMQMTGIEAVTHLPQLKCGGVTNFGEAIRFLRARIDDDVPFLRDLDREVLRPVVFLLTDGRPTDEMGMYSDSWRSDFRSLVDGSWARHPNVVPFGYGGATREILTEVSTISGAAYLASEGGTGDALRNVIPTLLNTLVASARDNELRLPADVPGFIRVSPELIE